ncbi:uncharacterized protein LOC142979895 [Anticarsia gemmatalis]|uniref:uncharacterized protein LOC142979895 n=1 Tax=Anticarsia gemmatalis TaxID=129554 RepID=UPI003F76C477
MKLLLLSLFVAAVAAVPIPDDDAGAVEMIVNGVPDGEALEIGDIVDIKLKEHTDGNVVATDLLHPFTAVGIAEAAAAAAAEESIVPEPILPEPVLPEVVPEPIVLPEPVLPEIVPEPVILPEPVLPEALPESVVLPEPALPEVVPEPIVLPEPVAPEVVIPPATPEIVIPEPVPSPSAQFGEVYNDGVVSVTVNAPQAEDEGMLATLQSWLNMVINYFSEDTQTQTSHQIV